MPELVVLTTDACLFALLVAGLGFWIVARRVEHLRAPWREVWRRPAAVGAATVLAAFMLVAVADSVRFRLHPVGAAPEEGADAEVLSALDLWLTPLRTGVETSYSAPLATHAYSRESVSDGAGGLRRVHPRLRHGGAHLADPARERAADITRRVLAGVAGGLLCGLLAATLVTLREASRRRCTPVRAARALLGSDATGAWRALLVVVTGLAIVVGVCAALAPHYHVLGTDKVGNDVLYQALKSIRTGMLIGSLTTLISLPFALVLGIAAGYFRGVVDDVVQYLYTTLSSIPGVLLIAASALMLDVYMAKHAADFEALAVRADLRLLALCAILGITSWTSLCRLLRAEALKLREQEFHDRYTVKAEGQPTASATLRVLVEAMLHHYDWSLWLELCVLATRDTAAAAERDRMDRRWRAALRSVIQEGQLSGEFDPDKGSADDVMFVLAALLDGLAPLLTMRARGVTRDRVERTWLVEASRWLGPGFDARPLKRTR